MTMHVVKEMCFTECSPEEKVSTRINHKHGTVNTMTDQGSCLHDDQNGKYEHYSAGYMPENFLARSSVWLKTISNTPPFDDTLMKGGSNPEQQICDEHHHSMDHTQECIGSCDWIALNAKQMESKQSSLAHADVIPTKSANMDNVLKNRVWSRQYSESELQLSSDLQHSHETTENSFTSDDPRRYLRNQDSAVKHGHRSMSDLGFSKNVPGLKRSNTRTLALLQNPVFRKRLARTMGINPDSDNFSEVVYEKLSLKVEESFNQPTSLSSHASAASEKSLRLCCSTSDLGLLKDLQSHSGSSQAQQDEGPGCFTNGDLGRSSDTLTHDKEHDQTGVRKSSLDLGNTKLLSRTKPLSSFRIPSYSEFKTSRQRQRFISKSTTNLQSLVPTILEEDSNNSLDTVGNAQASDGTGLAIKPDGRADETSLYENQCPKPKERKRWKLKKQTHSSEIHNQAKIQTRLTNSDIINSDRNETFSRLGNMPEGEAVSLTKCSRRRCYSLGNAEDSYGKDSVEEVTVCALECVKDVNHHNELNSIRSCHMIKSDDDCSDSLEDVFLNPATDDKHAEHSDEQCALEDESRGSLVTEFSDSGCLVDNNAVDLDPCLDGDQRLKDDDAAMSRCVSDVSDMFTKKARQNSIEQKYKQNKSDPLNTKTEAGVEPRFNKTAFQRHDSKEDILKFLEMNFGESVSNISRVNISNDNNSHSCSREVDLLSSVDLCRADSGVGKESQDIPNEDIFCEDCHEQLSSPQGGSSSIEKLLVCTKCKQRRHQRKEAILEIVETEQNYGNDLSIINEHFYESMKNMGLLSAEQMKIIFINLAELITVNQYFLTQLKHALDAATKGKDDLLWTVHIGQLFLESSSMLLAYESYCINQSAAPVLLDQLLEEKDLLRIFLEVTQREKSVLRKMDLKAFLMVPVQRIMKYPLLLSRLHKMTPSSHSDYENIASAQRKIESILELINAKTKGSSVTKLRRRPSSLRRSLELDGSVYDDIEIRKVAMEALGWDRSNLHFMHTGCLHCAIITDNASIKRGKNLKYAQIHGVLMTFGKNCVDAAVKVSTDVLRHTQVEKAAFVLVKEKGNKQQLFRDPFLLNQCIICLNEDNRENFEIHDANKDSLIFKCEQVEDMNVWFRKIKFLISQLSRWRHRRNALANIMLQDL